MYTKLMMVFMLLLLPALTSAAPPALLHQTGQIKCYDPAGAETACAGSGQDGEGRAGVAWPDPRFTGSPDGTTTIVDNLTGLIWSMDADPGTTDGTGKKSWQNALEYIKTLNANNYSGHNDWRLPNLHELKSLLNYQEVPSSWLGMQVFTNVQADNYWTSTTSTTVGKTASAWLINLGTSVIDDLANKYLAARVWPVRGDDNGGLISLPKTGQTGCWDELGVSVPCADTRQDGNLQAGVIWPEPRFLDMADGTIKDILTGLIWSKDAFPAGIEKDWQGALTVIATLNSNNYLGYDNWRLPNSLEMESLVNLQEPDSSTWLVSKGFSNVQADYWTATSDVASPGNAWRVTLSDVTNYSRVKSELNNVWPVRTDTTPPVVTASPAGGKHHKPLSITLSANEPATIHYTTNGAEPTLQSTTYSAPFSVSLDTAVKFLGVDALGNVGAVTTENYIIVPLTTANPPGGTYSSPQSVTLTANEPATIYYTTNGSEPTPQSKVYSAPLTISSDTTLKFFGVNSLGNAEDIRTESYLFVLKVDGKCGSANGSTLTSPPTTNLCAAGDPSAVSGAGPWYWTCFGEGGGANASCTANITTYQVSFIAGSGGSISDPTTQTVKHGYATTEVSAVPAVGHHFVNWTGTGGFTSTANPLTITNVTASQTITANFAPDTLTVTFTAGTNGTVTGTLSQTVNYGSPTSAVTAKPSPGYHFVNWTGTGGFVATANPLTIASVTATMTVTANFAADPPTVTITTKPLPLDKDLSYKKAKKKLSFTAANATLEQIVKSISKPDWILIDPATIKFAKGKGSLTFTLGPNPTITRLSGVIKIGTAEYLVAQAPTPCKILSLTASKIPVSKDGGPFTVAVDVFPDACSWRVASAAVTPCVKGNEPACLNAWFSAGPTPAVGANVVGDGTFSGTVTPVPTAKARSFKGVIEIVSGGKSVKKFSIKQVAK